MDPELSALIPVFVEEARERLERLASLTPRLASDGEATADAKRELHTLKGAGRMMQLAELAEICHAAEDLLSASPAAAQAALTRVVDRLMQMVEEVATGGTPAPAPDLLAELRAALDSLDSVDAASWAPSAAPAEVPANSPPAPISSPARAAAPRASATAELRVDAAALDSIAERAIQVRIMALATHRAVVRLEDLAALASEGMREPQPAQVLAVLATTLRRTAAEIEASQRRLARAGEEQVEMMLTLQLQPLRGVLRSLARYARDLGRSLGREVEVEIEGEDTRLDRRVARELEEALIHLVRNGVDHGLETPAERQAAGKSRSGHLSVRARASGPRVRLILTDDGRGIDPQAVLRKAVEGGWVDSAAAPALPPAEILNFLFAPGFSTREAISEISGRGVGLDVVAAALARVGGEVKLESEIGKGTTFTLEVPVARRGEQVLLLRVGSLRLALPSSVVRRVDSVSATSLVEREGRLFVMHEGRLVPFVPLARLYGQPEVERFLLLQGESLAQPLALAVDAIEGEEEVLVRPLPRAVAADRLLEGMALLASGDPVVVLSPAALAHRETLRSPGSVPLPVMAAKRVRVLLVDDSRVTREMERRLLEDAGFEVTAAVDGEDALRCLSEHTFDCVVADIEMPHMDGFELTEQLRGLERFAHLPIVVVSTRDRPEDRLRGLKAGADAYLTKQALNATELIDLVRRLGGG